MKLHTPARDPWGFGEDEERDVGSGGDWRAGRIWHWAVLLVCEADRRGAAMKLRLRLVLTVVWAMLLILTVAATAIWIRSYWVADAWGWSAEKRAYQCGIALGR